MYVLLNVSTLIPVVCCFGGTPPSKWGKKGSVSIFVCQFKQWMAIKVLQNPQSLPYPSKSYMVKCKHLTQDKCLWDNKPLFSRWSWKRTHLQQNRFYLRWMSLEWGRELDTCANPCKRAEAELHSQNLWYWTPKIHTVRQQCLPKVYPTTDI